ncbi:uncharacterized protein GGS22DRAFT_186434 [Annulohypoxylon maeteangense]|uniref:uncharacterized protein n=1 Tax=Annulohypoxylon maeteangense TaxID=1927788 RepID=UPI0020083D1E|nr:uncharacterized protein GGS22DRAFT_186434 [Annulohypoxylon maeteangense]KAI0887601.1 hypothetical protein GGS22DRAFT_186434 [Annulohypoxylon maeteangense]
MAPIDLRLPAKPPAVKFPDVNFKELHRGIGIPIPPAFSPPSPPTSSPLATSAPLGTHQTSAGDLYPSPESASSLEAFGDRRRPHDRHRGRRERDVAARNQGSRAQASHRQRSPYESSSPCQRGQVGRRHRSTRTSRRASPRSPSPTSHLSAAAKERQEVHEYFFSCLRTGSTELTAEEQEFLVGYLSVSREDERELVRGLVRQLEWSGCSVALIYKLAAWIHFHDGCDQTVVGLLTSRLSLPDALDRMRSIEKEEELVMCRTIIGISEKRLAKRGRQ